MPVFKICDGEWVFDKDAPLPGQVKDKAGDVEGGPVEPGSASLSRLGATLAFQAEEMEEAARAVLAASRADGAGDEDGESCLEESERVEVAEGEYVFGGGDVNMGEAAAGLPGHQQGGAVAGAEGTGEPLVIEKRVDDGFEMVSKDEEGASAAAVSGGSTSS